MGILDDAIRQHLELKRHHGAPESELKQLEDEAFGPPERPGDAEFPDSEGSPDQSGNGAAAEAVSGPDPGAPEPPPEPSATEHQVVEPPDETPDPAVVEEGPEAASESEELTTVYDHTSEAEPEGDQLEMEPEPLEPPVADAPVESLDTVEHALPDEGTELEEPEGEPPPEGEAEPEQEGEREDDVLADTPDFLRDAPEDDELWFEQGKPKDFDF
jgi:hypothetical protein